LKNQTQLADELFIYLVLISINCILFSILVCFAFQLGNYFIFCSCIYLNTIHESIDIAAFDYWK